MTPTPQTLKPLNPKPRDEVAKVEGLGRRTAARVDVERLTFFLSRGGLGLGFRVSVKALIPELQLGVRKS